MDTTENRPEGSQAMQVYLLSIRGTQAREALEETRKIHNETAGAPANVAAAQALGDLSHMVYVPSGAPGAEPNEFLILDMWNSLEGLNRFFENPQVQEQAGRIFTQRDPVVWAPAAGFTGFHLPAPSGKNDRIVATVRGTVSSHAEARSIHNAIINAQTNNARKAGAISHEAYLRLAQPQSPQALEFFAVDVWMDAAGMAQQYARPDLAAAFDKLFVSPASVSVWVHPANDWVEW